MSSRVVPLSHAERRLSDSTPVVTAVMPCLNEERTVGLCVAKAMATFRAIGIDGEVVVADNGSTDRSVEIAESMGARVVREARRGYGAALQRGIREARGDIIVMGDADDSYDWSAIGPFVRKVQEGFDLVMGNRFRGGIKPGAMPRLHRYVGNPVLSMVARIAFRVPVGDFHCGMRAFSRDALSENLIDLLRLARRRNHLTQMVNPCRRTHRRWPVRFGGLAVKLGWICIAHPT